MNSQQTTSGEGLPSYEDAPPSYENPPAYAPGYQNAQSQSPAPRGNNGETNNGNNVQMGQMQQPQQQQVIVMNMQQLQANGVQYQLVPVGAAAPGMAVYNPANNNNGGMGMQPMMMQPQSIEAITRPEKMFTQGDALPVNGRATHPICNVHSDADSMPGSPNGINNEDEEDTGSSSRKCATIMTILLWFSIIFRFYCGTGTSCYCSDESYFSSYCWTETCSVPAGCWNTNWTEFTWSFDIALILICIFYLFESLVKASTRRYLNNVYDANTIEGWVNEDWIKCNSSIKWIVQNYHYVTTRDSKGHTHRRRVNTQRFEDTFKYTSIVDISGEYNLQKQLNEGSPLIKLQFERGLRFADVRTENIYNHQLLQYVNACKTDSHHDFTLLIDIPGFQERVMCKAQNFAVFNWSWYILATLLGCSLFFRMYIDSKSSRKSFSITKKVGI